MGKYLDLDDVAATSEVATSELAELRAVLAKAQHALAKAREALEGIHPGNMTPMAEENWRKALAAIDALKP